MSLVTILNNLRAELPRTYAEIVPEATQDNIDDVLAALNSNALIQQAATQLLGKIAGEFYLDNGTGNPLAKYAKGIIAAGTTIEEYALADVATQIQTIEDLDDRTVAFQTAKAFYHSENMHHKTKYSVSRKWFKGSFNDVAGIQGYLNNLELNHQASLENSVYKTYRAIIERWMTEAKKIADGKNIITLDYMPSNKSDVEDMLVAARTVIGKAKFRNNAFHTIVTLDPVTGAPTTTRDTRFQTALDNRGLVVFTTPETQALVDVKALADMINVDRASITFEVVDSLTYGAEITDGHIPLMVICDSRGLMFYETYREVFRETIGSNATDNIWTHLDGIVSYSPSASIIVIEAAAVSAESIELPIVYTGEQAVTYEVYENNVLRYSGLFEGDGDTSVLVNKNAAIKVMMTAATTAVLNNGSVGVGFTTSGRTVTILVDGFNNPDINVSDTL